MANNPINAERLDDLSAKLDTILAHIVSLATKAQQPPPPSFQPLPTPIPTPTWSKSQADGSFTTNPTSAHLFFTPTVTDDDETRQSQQIITYSASHSRTMKDSADTNSLEAAHTHRLSADSVRWISTDATRQRSRPPQWPPPSLFMTPEPVGRLMNAPKVLTNCIASRSFGDRGPPSASNQPMRTRFKHDFSPGIIWYSQFKLLAGDRFFSYPVSHVERDGSSSAWILKLPNQLTDPPPPPEPPDLTLPTAVVETQLTRYPTLSSGSFLVGPVSHNYDHFLLMLSRFSRACHHHFLLHEYYSELVGKDHVTIAQRFSRLLLFTQFNYLALTWYGYFNGCSLYLCSKYNLLMATAAIQTDLARTGNLNVCLDIFNCCLDIQCVTCICSLPVLEQLLCRLPCCQFIVCPGSNSPILVQFRKWHCWVVMVLPLLLHRTVTHWHKLLHPKLLSVSSIFPFLYFMVRNHNVAHTGADICSFAGFVDSSLMLRRALTFVLWRFIFCCYGRKPVIVLGLVIVITFIPLFANSTSFWIVVIFSSLLGRLYCLVHSITYSIEERVLISQLLSPKFGGLFVYESLPRKPILVLHYSDSPWEAYTLEHANVVAMVFGHISKTISHRGLHYNGIYTLMFVDDLKQFFGKYSNSAFTGFIVGIPSSQEVLTFYDVVHPVDTLVLGIGPTIFLCAVNTPVLSLCDSVSTSNSMFVHISAATKDSGVMAMFLSDASNLTDTGNIYSPIIVLHPQVTSFILSNATSYPNAIIVHAILGHFWRNVIAGSNETLGESILHTHGLLPNAYWYWICVGALLGYAFLFNSLFPLALHSFSPFRREHAWLFEEKLLESKACTTEDFFQLIAMISNFISFSHPHAPVNNVVSEPTTFLSTSLCGVAAIGPHANIGMHFGPPHKPLKIEGLLQDSKAENDVVHNPLGKSGGSFILQSMLLNFGLLATPTPNPMVDVMVFLANFSVGVDVDQDECVKESLLNMRISSKPVVEAFDLEDKISLKGSVMLGIHQLVAMSLLPNWPSPRESPQGPFTSKTMSKQVTILEGIAGCQNLEASMHHQLVAYFHSLKSVRSLLGYSP